MTWQQKDAVDFVDGKENGSACVVRDGEPGAFRDQDFTAKVGDGLNSTINELVSVLQVCLRLKPY